MGGASDGWVLHVRGGGKETPRSRAQAVPLGGRGGPGAGGKSGASPGCGEPVVRMGRPHGDVLLPGGRTPRWGAEEHLDMGVQGSQAGRRGLQSLSRVRGALWAKDRAPEPDIEDDEELRKKKLEQPKGQEEDRQALLSEESVVHTVKHDTEIRKKNNNSTAQSTRAPSGVLGFGSQFFYLPAL